MNWHLIPITGDDTVEDLLQPSRLTVVYEKTFSLRENLTDMNADIDIEPFDL